jgi:HEPN domain-containing protein
MTTDDRIRSRESDWYPPIDHLFRLSQAYLDCSNRLFHSLHASELPRTFDHVRAASFLFEHALELFLKGAIMSATGKQTFGHNLHDLYARFLAQYGDRFTFESEIERFTELDPNSTRAEYSRYPFDKDGEDWVQGNSVSLQRAIVQTDALKRDFNRVIASICGTNYDYTVNNPGESSPTHARVADTVSMNVGAKHE